jgi:hypothetical protein
VADRQKRFGDVKLHLLRQEAEQMLGLVQHLDQCFLAAFIVTIQVQHGDEGIQLGIGFGRQHPFQRLRIHSWHKKPP